MNKNRTETRTTTIKNKKCFDWNKKKYKENKKEQSRLQK